MENKIVSKQYSKNGVKKSAYKVKASEANSNHLCFDCGAKLVLII